MPEAARPGVVALQERLRGLPIDCKYVEPENLHVSLSFLGEVPGGEVAGVAAKLQSVCERNSAFRLVADELKLIPSESYVRVIVLDVHDASGALASLFEAVKRDIRGDAKPPHLTLCRVRNVSDKTAVAEKIKKMKFDEVAFDVGEVALIESKLGRSGPAYSVVKSFKLNQR